MQRRPTVSAPRLNPARAGLSRRQARATPPPRRMTGLRPARWRFVRRDGARRGSTEGGGDAGPALPETPDRYKFPLATTTPRIVREGGSITAALPDNFPVLKDNQVSVGYLVLKPGALREPHWHPTHWEVDYAVQGTGELGIVTPGDEQNISRLGPGDIGFIPTGWAQRRPHLGARVQQPADRHRALDHVRGDADEHVHPDPRHIPQRGAETLRDALHRLTGPHAGRSPNPPRRLGAHRLPGPWAPRVRRTASRPRSLERAPFEERCAVRR